MSHCRFLKNKQSSALTTDIILFVIEVRPALVQETFTKDTDSQHSGTRVKRRLCIHIRNV
jgi:hypothetical protein